MAKSPPPIIPLPTAHEILAAFGLSQNTKGYNRYARPEGFKLEDFREILSESPLIFSIDWRAILQEEIPRILHGLSQLGCDLTFQATDEVSGVLTAPDGRELGIDYIPTDGDFDVVIGDLQQLVGPNIEFRESPENRGSDTWSYAILNRDHWLQLESIDQALVRYFFIPIKIDSALPTNPEMGRASSQGFFDSLFQSSKSGWLKIIAAAAFGVLFGAGIAAKMKDNFERAIGVAGGAALGAIGAGILVYNDWAVARHERLGRPRKPLIYQLVGCMMIVGMTLGVIAMVCGFIAGIIKAWHWLFGLVI
jgi:hypothetical protein